MWKAYGLGEGNRLALNIVPIPISGQPRNNFRTSCQSSTRLYFDS